MKFASSYEPSEFEPDIYAAWETSGAFQPTTPTVPIDNNADGIDDRFETSARNTYSLVLPPPNANGNLHIGHGLVVSIEDSLTRFYRLNGKSAWYVPGADHAGFETWVVYEKALEKQGHSRFEYDRDTLYARVWDFVAEQRGNMELQLRALGASCAWSDLTFTLDENVIDRVYTTFEKMWNDGLIYRGEKLVNFCPKHQTAFADIEVEHQDELGTLWDIAYDDIVVSTTRPETLFGDTAIAVNPNDPRYKDKIGTTVHLPLTTREIPIIADEHADMEFGTGAVKITPAHDFDDFEVGNRHNLERIQVISEDGHMINVPDRYLGLTPAECRKQVLKDLKTQDLLVAEHKITHSVAHCYKCGTVLEPTLKEQWFIDVKTLAADAIKHLEQGEITFYPENKQRVLINYLENLKDWNISRQIPWGIAIPMFRKADPTATDEPDWIFDRRTHLKEIEKSGVKYIRDEDTFDTWFSSSHWPIVCTDWSEENPTPYYPLNVMETAADILFAWVARMIMTGLYVTGEVPFKEVYLHGLVLDAHGQKMSKSKGNVLNPIELVARYGSDAFRLGILRGRSAGMNQAFSENSVISGRNLCNKLWNISRLIQSIVDEDGGEGLDESVGAAPQQSAGTNSQNHNVSGASTEQLRAQHRRTRCDFDDCEPRTVADGTPAAPQVIAWDVKSLMHADEKIAKRILVGEHFWDLSQAAFLLNPLSREAPQLMIPEEEYQRQLAELQKFPKLYQVLTDLDLPLIPILYQMERKGMAIDRDYFAKLRTEYATEVNHLEQQIYSLAGTEFNLNSPIQLSEILFTKLQLPTKGIKKTARGYSTGAKELDKLHDLHPIVEQIINYREAAKLLSTYIIPLPDLADTNGRIHTTFTQNVTATGRLSSKDPNLQNIPVRTDEGKRIRTGFVAPAGRVLVSADYSQFELRLAAVLAGDTALIDDFNHDIDIHTKTASEAFNIPFDQVTKAQRRAAKVVNFGILYGMSVKGLAEAAHMSVLEAKTFIDNYFRLRAPIKQYLDRILIQAREQGFVETYYGRRRPTPDVQSPNFLIRQAAERAAANMPIQGTEADLMKRAMIRIHRALPTGADLVMQVHDSLIVECDEALADQVSSILKHEMESVAPELPIKLAVDVSTATNWGEL